MSWALKADLSAVILLISLLAIIFTKYRKAGAAGILVACVLLLSGIADQPPNPAKSAPDVPQAASDEAKATPANPYTTMFAIFYGGWDQAEITKKLKGFCADCQVAEGAGGAIEAKLDDDRRISVYPDRQHAGVAAVKSRWRICDKDQRADYLKTVLLSFKDGKWKSVNKGCEEHALWKDDSVTLCEDNDAGACPPIEVELRQSGQNSR